MSSRASRLDRFINDVLPRREWTLESPRTPFYNIFPPTAFHISSLVTFFQLTA